MEMVKVQGWDAAIRRRKGEVPTRGSNCPSTPQRIGGSQEVGFTRAEAIPAMGTLAERSGSRPITSSAGTVSGVSQATWKARGGGVGGSSLREGRWKRQATEGGVGRGRMRTEASEGRSHSNLNSTWDTRGDEGSLEWRAWRMARQSEHGCWPSKVCATAWPSDISWENPTNMRVQATVCNAAQCRPRDRASARVTTVQRILCMTTRTTLGDPWNSSMLHSGGILLRTLFQRWRHLRDVGVVACAGSLRRPLRWAMVRNRDVAASSEEKKRKARPWGPRFGESRVEDGQRPFGLPGLQNMRFLVVSLDSRRQAS